MVFKILNWLERNGDIGKLRRCRGIEERHKKLAEMVSEFPGLDASGIKELAYELEIQHHLGFGVCPFFTIEMGKKQCSYNGRRVICDCAIPAPPCSLLGEGSESALR